MIKTRWDLLCVENFVSKLFALCGCLLFFYSYCRYSVLTMLITLVANNERPTSRVSNPTQSTLITQPTIHPSIHSLNQPLMRLTIWWWENFEISLFMCLWQTIMTASERSSRRVSERATFERPTDRPTGRPSVNQSQVRVAERANITLSLSLYSVLSIKRGTVQ